MAQAANPFGDIAKAIEQLKMPGSDTASLVEAQRKDIEALVETNRAAAASLQAFAGRQMEMLTQAMLAATRAAASGAGVGDPPKQAEMARNACQQALENMKELAEMARQWQTDVIAAVTRRAEERTKGAAKK